MKIVATADIHGAQYRLNILLDSIEKYHPDLVVICGDITQFGPGDIARNFLDQIPVDVFAVPGNIDTPDVGPAISESKATNLHLQKVNYRGVSFVGINGVDSSEVSAFLSDEDKKEWITSETVLVSHVPPFGYQDKVFFSKHSGSKELREVVDRYHPRLMLCGHIHENPGITETKESMIINCSMGKRGAGALIDINDDLSASMLDEDY
jgi:Icc-related predicted phosphoesterase